MRTLTSPDALRLRDLLGPFRIGPLLSQPEFENRPWESSSGSCAGSVGARHWLCPLWPHVGSADCYLGPSFAMHGWPGHLLSDPLMVHPEPLLASPRALHVFPRRIKWDHTGVHFSFPPGFRETIGFHGNQLFQPGVCSRILPRESGCHQAGGSVEVRTPQGTAKGVAHPRGHRREKMSQDSPGCVNRSGEAGWALCRAAGGCPCGAPAPGSAHCG